MIVVSGRVRLTEQGHEAAVRAAATAAAATREEPGCADYRFSLDVEDPRSLRVFEQWESQEALDAHVRTEHFRVLSEALIAAADGAPDFDRYDVSSVRPLFG